MGSHFQNKTALEHVIEARKKGAIAVSEIHGSELSAPSKALLFSIQEIAFLLPLLVIVLPSDLSVYLPIFLIGFILWNATQTTFRSWLKLGRLHRLIEEERWEIEHHFPQEKEELRALYAARGFSGKLLDETVEVLMADDNRLLQVMLEEELGLPLEAYDHPLKIGLFAFLGTSIFGFLTLTALFYLPLLASTLFAACLVGGSAIIQAKKEKHSMILSAVWSLACLLLALLSALFLKESFH